MSNLTNVLVDGNVTTTNDTVDPFDPSQCPVYDPYILNQMSFWLEGVVQVCVALGGLIANIISLVILSRSV